VRIAQTKRSKGKTSRPKNLPAVTELVALLPKLAIILNIGGQILLCETTAFERSKICPTTVENGRGNDLREKASPYQSRNEARK
jgi:hypothetical protein